MTTALIYLTGILVTAFIAYLLVEVVLDRTPKGALSDAYRHNDTHQNSRLQNALSPLGVPVQKSPRRPHSSCRGRYGPGCPSSRWRRRREIRFCRATPR